MAMYVTLYNLTDQGARAVKESPDRLAAAIEAGKQAGMKVIGAYYTQGPYDLVVITEADDEEIATAFTLGTMAQGNARSLTMRAWDPEAFRAIVDRIP